MDSIREGVKKPWAKILIFVIILSFIGAGYFTSALFLGDPNAAVVVNGQSISVQEFQRAYSRTRQQYGDAFKQFIKTEEQERNFRENVLQSLISQTVTLQTTQDLGMRVSNTVIRKSIHEIPAFQVDGVYASDMLDLALRNNQMSRAQLRLELEKSTLLNQLSSGISASEFVLPVELHNQYKIMGQLRTGRALPIKYSLFDAGLEISDEEIESSYQQTKEFYRIDEKVAVDYIELSVEQLQQNIEVAEEDVLSYFDENLDRFQTVEQRRVSHILIAIEDDESAALTKAQAIKTRIDAGEEFIALVKSESSDEFSAANDGDLGFVNEGDQEKPFEDAMNSLAAVGDVSAPIKTSFGYHLIKLTELIKGETQLLSEVKEEIVTALKKQTAEEQFYAKAKILEEKAFEISDSLTEVSELVDVTIKTSDIFSRKSAVGVFANTDVIEAVFSDNLVNLKTNSNIINITDTHVIVMRLNQHQASKIQPLDAVKDKIIASLKSSKAKQIAIEFGDLIKQKLAAQEDISGMIAAKNIIWKDLDKVQRTSAELPYQQLKIFFKMNKPSKDRTVIETMKDNSEYVIFVLNSVEEGQLDKAEETIVTQSKQRLTQFYGQANYSSLIEQQRKGATVSRNELNIER